MKAPAGGGSLSVLQGTALTLAAVLGTGVISLPALAVGQSLESFPGVRTASTTSGPITTVR